MAGLVRPLDFGKAALYALFGYHLRGPMMTTPAEPESIPLVKFGRSRYWWKFWKR